jgi:hypothetical protein
MRLTVEAPDVQSAMTLVQRLVGAVGGEAVSLAASDSEVRVDARNEPERALVEALDAIESWLADLELDQALVRCDGRPYTVRR